MKSPLAVFIKKSAAAVLAFVMVFAMSACGQTDDGSAQVAKVNNTVITQDELDCYSVINMQLLGYDPSAITEEQEKEFLDQLVTVDIVREYYKDKETEIYNEEYETNETSFVDSAHESAADFLKQYEISDDQLKDFYRGQYAVSELFKEIQQENASVDMYELASEYYENNKELFLNDDGEYEPLDDVIQSVYYALYSEMYDEKVTELRKDMTIKIND